MIARSYLGSLLLFTILTTWLCGGCSSRKSPTDSNTSNTRETEDNRLTLYTSFSSELYEPIAELFEKETGIKVDIVFGGTGDMMKRIEAEKFTPQADVMLGGGSESYEAYRAAFEPYRLMDDLAIPENLKSMDRLWYANNLLPVVIIYNKKLVKDSERPTKWKDLLDTKWQGKIVMANATKSGTAYTQVLIILTVFGKDNGKGWSAMRSLVQNAKIVDSSSLVSKGVHDGEYALALSVENAARKYVKADENVGILYPEEGTANMVDSAAIVRGTRHRQNARRFMDWLYGKSGQALLARLGLRPVRSDVPVKGLPPIDSIHLLTIDQAWAVMQRQTILSGFQDLVSNQ